MDAYEATKIVFSRIQSLDPENAAKIMGFLLIHDHGEKEMIRLAFGPESLLQSVVFNARKDLGILLPSSPSAASPPAQLNPFDLTRQISSRLPVRPSPLAVSSPSSWAQLSPLSRTADEIHAGGGEELVDELHHHGGIGEVFYPEECWSPRADELFPYGMGWGAVAKGGAPRRSLGSFSDVAGLVADPIALGWKPCLYFARGYCKNGSSCRFLHSLAGHSAAAGKMDPAVEQELLLRSKSQRQMTPFPNSPTGPLPQSPLTPTGKCMNYFLQQQQLLQNESQRVVATAAALMLGREEQHKFMGRPRIERSDFAGMVNPGSRQIYLTFPADSTFQEEDVSNYFSIYGPVQDVRIPYQQKRMFGFVTFLYSETVKLILAMGNPHFVCDSRILVKPYKEKGKLSDKYTLEEQQELQHAIELQQRRFMGLQLLAVNRNPPTFTAAAVISPPRPCLITTATNTSEGDQEEMTPKEDSGFKESSVDHNLPDSPFASPTKSVFQPGDSLSLASEAAASSSASAILASTTSTGSMASFKSCFFPMPRFSSSPEEVGL